MDNNEKVRISEEEHTRLIYESSREKVLHCVFRIGWVGLIVCPENRWALERVLTMRRGA